MSVVDSKVVDVSIAQQALSIQPNISNVISTEAFYKLCNKLYTSAQMQRNLISNQELSLQRGMVFNMVSRIYSDNVCTLEPPDTLYTTWLANRNIDLTNLDINNLDNLYNRIVSAATGTDLVTVKSLKDIQLSMINILTQLSYNILLL